MNFRRINSTTAVSECGGYTIRGARTRPDGPMFFNAWAGEKHIAASFGKAEVKEACRAHAAKGPREVPR